MRSPRHPTIGPYPIDIGGMYGIVEDYVQTGRQKRKLAEWCEEMAKRDEALAKQDEQLAEQEMVIL